MKIIIFIIIACTLFVAWSLCVVGASADEQLEMIYAKDLERKEQREKLSTEIDKTSNAEDNVELSLTFGLEGKGVDGYATVTAEQQEVAAYVFADTQKTGA